MSGQDEADSPFEHSLSFLLCAFEAPQACLAAELVHELAGGAPGSTVDREWLRDRWIERWPALTHGIGKNSVAGRLDLGLRMLHAAGVVQVDEHAGTVTVTDPTLLAMSANNRLIVTRPDGCRIRPRNWTRTPTVPEHLELTQQRHHQRQFGDILREPGPLAAEAHPGYSLALRSRDFTGTVATCAASLQQARQRHLTPGGFHLGLAVVDNHGGWWVAREYLGYNWSRRMDLAHVAELVAAAAAITHHPRSVHILTGSTSTCARINRWRRGTHTPGPSQPGILALAAELCQENPDRFTVKWIPQNTTAHHRVAHELSCLLSANKNEDMNTIADIKTRATELTHNLP